MDIKEAQKKFFAALDRVEPIQVPAMSKLAKGWLEDAQRDIVSVSGIPPTLVDRSDHMMDALRYSLWADRNIVYRRVIWQDVLVDYGIAKVSLKHTLRFFKNLLITMKDFLLTKSRSFSASSVSQTTNSNSLASGWADKPAPSFNVTIVRPEKVTKRLGSTSTTFSGGSRAKRKVRRSSSTKYKWKGVARCGNKNCWCGDK